MLTTDAVQMPRCRLQILRPLILAKMLATDADFRCHNSLDVHQHACYRCRNESGARGSNAKLRCPISKRPDAEFRHLPLNNRQATKTLTKHPHKGRIMHILTPEDTMPLQHYS